MMLRREYNMAEKNYFKPPSSIRPPRLALLVTLLVVFLAAPLGSVSAETDCSKYRCARDCTEPCGWSTKDGLCMEGSKTTAVERRRNPCAPDCATAVCAKSCTMDGCGWSSGKKACLLGSKTTESELYSGDCSPGSSTSKSTVTASATINDPLRLPDCSGSICAKDCTEEGCGWSSTKKLCLLGGKTTEKERASNECSSDLPTTATSSPDQPVTESSRTPTTVSPVVTTTRTQGTGSESTGSPCPYYAAKHFVEGRAVADARTRLGMIGNVRSLELCANVCRTFLTGDQCKSFWYDDELDLCDLSSYAGSVSETSIDAAPVWLRTAFCEPPLEPPPSTSTTATSTTRTSHTTSTRTTLSVTDELKVHKARASISTLATQFTFTAEYSAEKFEDGVSIVAILKSGQTTYSELILPLVEAEGKLEVVVPLPRRGLDAGVYSLLVYTAPNDTPIVRKNYVRVDATLEVKVMPICPTDATQQFAFQNVSGQELVEQHASDILDCATKCVGTGDACSGFKFHPAGPSCIRASNGVYLDAELESPFLMYARFEYNCFTKPPTTSTTTTTRTTTSPPSTTPPPPIDSVDVVQYPEFIATAATKIGITLAFTTSNGHESGMALAGTLKLGSSVVASFETPIFGRTGRVNVMMDVEANLVASSSYKLIVFMAAEESVSIRNSVARYDLKNVIVEIVPFCPAVPILHFIPASADELRQTASGSGSIGGFGSTDGIQPTVSEGKDLILVEGVEEASECAAICLDEGLACEGFEYNRISQVCATFNSIGGKAEYLTIDHFPMVIATSAKNVPLTFTYRTAGVVAGVSVRAVLKLGKAVVSEMTHAFTKPAGTLTLLMPLTKKLLAAKDYQLIMFTAPSNLIKIQSKLERADVDGVHIVTMPRCAEDSIDMPTVDGVSTYTNIAGNEVQCWQIQTTSTTTSISTTSATSTSSTATTTTATTSTETTRTTTTTIGLGLDLTLSCANNCGFNRVHPGTIVTACYCDKLCLKSNDCCHDFIESCEMATTTGTLETPDKTTSSLMPTSSFQIDLSTTAPYTSSSSMSSSSSTSTQMTTTHSNDTIQLLTFPDLLASVADSVHMEVGFTTAPGHAEGAVLAGVLKLGATQFGEFYVPIQGSSGKVSVKMPIEQKLVVGGNYKMIIYMAHPSFVSIRKAYMRIDVKDIVVEEIPFCPPNAINNFKEVASWESNVVMSTPLDASFPRSSSEIEDIHMCASMCIEAGLLCNGFTYDASALSCVVFQSYTPASAGSGEEDEDTYLLTIFERIVAKCYMSTTMTTTTTTKTSTLTTATVTTATTSTATTTTSSSTTSTMTTITTSTGTVTTSTTSTLTSSTDTTSTSTISTSTVTTITTSTLVPEYLSAVHFPKIIGTSAMNVPLTFTYRTA
eukprot:gene6570-12055_t